MFTADESGEIPEEISLSEASDQEAEEEILEFDDPIDPESLAPGGIFEYDDDFEDYDSEEVEFDLNPSFSLKLSYPCLPYLISTENEKNPNQIMSRCDHHK